MNVWHQLWIQATQTIPFLPAMAKTLGVRSRRPMPQMADMKHHQFFSVYVYGRNDL